MELSHQDKVDRLIVLKAMSDYFKDMFDNERKEYTDAELERTKMPRGDESEYGTIYASFFKAEEGATTIELVVEDEALLMADKDEDAMEWFKTTWWPEHKGQFAEDWFAESGAVLDGCTVVTTHEPDIPKTFRYFNVKANENTKKKVVDALDAPTRWLLPGSKDGLGEVEQHG